MSSELSHHPNSFNTYIQHGWKLTLIEPRSKKPCMKEWNVSGNHIRSCSDIPNHYGCGLLHAFSGTMALDIDHVDESKIKLTDMGIELDVLLNDERAVCIKSGKAGRAKLLYAMPEGVVLPSKKIAYDLQDGGSSLAFELRCGSESGGSVQDVLPPSIHPEMLRPYEWGGLGHWSNLPLIPDLLLEYWKELIHLDESFTCVPRNNQGDVKWNEVMKCLGHVDPDLSYDEWVRVGMGLQSAGAESGCEESAFRIFDAWSSLSSHKYPGTAALFRQWKAFRPDKGVTIGTVYHHAYQGGYRSPNVDMSTFFSPIEDDISADPWALLQPKMPEINLNHVPKVLADRAREIGTSKGADYAVSVAAGLIAVCGALHSKSRLHVRSDWVEPPILWCMTVGDSAQKKTPAFKPMFETLSAIQDEDEPNFNKKYKEWKTKEARYAVDKKTHIELFKNENMTDEERNALYPDEIPPKPKKLRLTVQDITSQALTRLAAVQPRGLTCVLDELSSWFKRIVDTRGMEDRGAWVTAFEGGEYEADRVIDGGSYKIKGFAVSMYGNAQPELLERYFPELRIDGLINRFMPFPINDKYVKLSEPIDEMLTSAHVWDSMLRRVYAAPITQYTVTPEAYDVLRAWEATMLRATKNEKVLKTDSSMISSFGKAHGLAARLALVFHVMVDPLSTEVGAESATKAVEFIKGYTLPAVKYTFGEVCGVNGRTFELYLGELIIHLCDNDNITASQIKRHAHGQFKKLKVRGEEQKNIMIWENMERFEALGWVLFKSESPKNKTWAVNPYLKTTFAKRKERIRQAKAESQKMLITSLTNAKRGITPLET